MRKIRSITINGLFDRYNYSLSFNDNCRYLLLTSPNGYGKTTILTIVDSLAKSDLVYFYYLSFNKIHLSFDDDSEISVESRTIERKSIDSAEVSDIPSEGGREIFFLAKNSLGDENRFILNERFIQKAIRSVGYYEGRRIHFGEETSSREMREFVRNNPRVLDLIAREQNGSSFLLQIKELQTVFIEAQRIYSTHTNREFFPTHVERNNNLASYSVDEVSKRIQELMRRARYNYLEYAQIKNNQLIYRLLSNNYEFLHREEYNRIRENLLEKTRELQQYGLIEDADIPDYDEAHSKELSAHIADMVEKLSQLDEIFKKVKLFTDLINKKQFTAKTISISALKGVRVQTEELKWISLSDLSSGEQNIIIMLYYLVFEFDRNKLLLIDEPEISIHVAWQYQYMDELEDILSLVDGQAIIATHSPQIIGERWDKCCDLTE